MVADAGDAKQQTGGDDSAVHPSERWGAPISKERQAELRALFERQQVWAAQPEATRGGSVFKRVQLSGAEVFWLAEASGPDEVGNVPNLHLEKADLHMAQLTAAILSEAQLAGADLRVAQLAGADLRMAQLVGADLSDAQLERANLCKAQLEGADLSGTRLAAADLSEAQMKGTNLSGAQLERAILRKAQLEGADLGEAQLAGANLGGAQLKRADLRWTQLAGADLHEATLTGANLGGAQLAGANLSGAQLARANLGGAQLAGANLRKAQLEGAILNEAKLAGANLSDAQLARANLGGAQLAATNLSGAQLERANLGGAQLSGADLRWTQLAGADLHEATLVGVNLSGAQLAGVNLSDAQLEGTNLKSATFDKTSHLKGAVLTGVSLDQATYDGVNLTVVDWSLVPILGDELTARQSKNKDGTRKDEMQRLDELTAAVRAYRVLAVTLRSQGMNEDADHYAYRGQRMQRAVLRLRRRYLTYLGSLFIDLLAGYGFRPERSLLVYLAVILWFANFYVWASHGLFSLGLPPTHVQPLAWYEGLILSVSSFHGRGFQPFQQLNDPIAALAGMQAVFGLIIEVSFIATFTQRFFAR